MNDLILRPPQPHERADLLDLWVAAWRKTFPDIDFDARRDWFIEHVAKLESSGARTVCAYADDVLHGFVVIDPTTGWLDQIAVHPDLFGSGVAHALLDAARGVSPDRIALDVNAENFRALKFYEREAFVRTGEGVNPNSGRKTVKLEWRR